MKKAKLELGQMIYKYRIKRGMTQLELANRLGYDSPQFVSLFERNLSKVPLETLGELIVILKIPEALARMQLLDFYKQEINNKIEMGKNKAKGA